MPQNIVSGKPSNQSAREVDIPPTTRILVFLMHRRVGVRFAQRIGVRSCSRATDVRPAHWMCVRFYSRLWCHWSTSRNERQTVASELSLDVPSVWVRFALARFWNSIQNHPFLTEIKNTWSLCHIEKQEQPYDSQRWCLFKGIYHAWIIIVAYLERIIN
jgi:hypothetical protein